MENKMKFSENADHYKKYLDMCKSEAYQKLQKFYHRKTFFDITGIARQENPHSSFIAWLLNPYESHGMGEYPMKRFLETLCFAYNEYGHKYLNEENKSFKNYSNDEAKKEIAQYAQKTLLFFNGNEDDADKKHFLKKMMQGDYRINSCEINREKSLPKGELIFI